MLTNVDQVDLTVPDLAVALDFFTGVGLVEARRSVRGSVEVALPGQSRVMFKLREDPTVDGFVIDRIAFAAGDQMGGVAAVAGATGLVDRENAVVPATGRTASGFIDPYGTRWEFSTRSA